MSEHAVRGVGIDFGAGACRVAAVEGTAYKIIIDDYRVKPCPLIIRPGGLSTGVQREPGGSNYAHHFHCEAIKRNLGMEKTISHGGKKLRNDEAAIDILRNLRVKGEAQLEGAITGVAITVPPCFSDRQTAAMKYCAEAAGFRNVTLVDDSRAAALAYSRESGRRGRWLVYGLGKSAFYVTALDTTDDIKLLAHNGNAHLGGDDFDALIVDAVIADDLTKQGIFSKPGGVSSDPRVGGELLRLAAECKERLSSQEKAEIEHSVMGIRFSLSRAEFERLIADKIEETITLTEQTIKEADLKPEEIDRILLVGRSTSIPLVKSELSRLIGKEMEQLPDDMIAKGAAIYSTRLGACFSRSPKASLSSPAPELSAPPAQVELPPKMSSLWTKVQSALGDKAYDEAIIAYEDFLKAAQEDLSYICNAYAARLEGQGKKQEAMEILERTDERFPGNPVVAGKLIDIYIGRAEELKKQGSINEAVKLLHRGHKRFPENSAIAHALSDLYVDYALADFDDLQRGGQVRGLRNSLLGRCKESVRKSLQYNRNNPRALELSNVLGSKVTGPKKFRGKNKKSDKR
ncbi:MAG: Hsp70 family protein [Blastocatellia bacterium]|nr:Hsp70 family protein [Blastocatellia bacterium]